LEKYDYDIDKNFKKINQEFNHYFSDKDFTVDLKNKSHDPDIFCDKMDSYFVRVRASTMHNKRL
jgi:hypothetical protein